MSHAHDEYIDYSCSTSVERLARDVETTLRKWHVADGSDRHVSFASSSSSSSHGGSRVASRRTSASGVADADAPDGSSDRMDVDTINNNIAPDWDADNGAVRLIRSEDVTLASFPLPSPLHEGDHPQRMQQSGYGGASSDRLDVALTLSLWDGPPRRVGGPTGDGDDEISPPLPPLPLSLMDRYDLSGGVMPPSITSDLCALLGIGQHITLTPKVKGPTYSANDATEIPAEELINAEAAMLLQSMVLARGKARSAKDQRDGKRAKVKSALRAFTKDKAASSEEIMDHLHGSATLCSLLQTALNFAISACDCRIPAFGLWTGYDPQKWRETAVDADCVKSGGEFAIPLWLAGGWAAMDEKLGAQNATSSIAMTIPIALQEVSFPSPIPDVLPTHQIPAALSGRCHPGPKLGSACGSFSIYAIPPGLKGGEHLGSLNGLAHMMLSKIAPCEANKGAIAVVAARHCYLYLWERGTIDAGERKRKWSPEDEAEALSLWRLSSNDVIKTGGDSSPLDDDTLAAIDYRHTCEKHVTRLLERAATLGKTDKQMQNHEHSDKGSSYPTLWGPDADPVLAIFASATWNGSTNPTYVVNSLSFESDAARGVEALEPLLSLPLKTRSSHTPSLTDVLEIESSLLSTIFDPRNVSPGAFEVGTSFDVDSPCTKLSASNRCLLAGLIKVANLDDETLVGHIVQRTVQDELHKWETDLDNAGQNPARFLMDRARVGKTTRQLFDVMDWTSMANAKRSHLEDDVEAALGVALGGGSMLDGVGFPSPPVGIFRSDESKDDYDNEPNPYSLDLSAFGSAPPGRLLSVFFTSLASLRTPSAMAAAWLALVEEMRSRWDERESLPNHGIIAGVDNAREEYTARRKVAENSGSSRLINFVSPPIGRQLGSRAICAAFVHSSEPDPDLHNCLIAQKLQIFNICVECVIAAESGYADMDIGVTETPSGEEFFDAGDGLDTSFQIDERIAGRKGVRCPVHGVSLIKTGDQLYAPYLQRTEPMSRDELTQRRALLAEAVTSPSGKTYSIQERLEVAHRLQKAKLSSDMSSFKSANPGACLEDFTGWYGNPDNPLDVYLEGEHNAPPSPPRRAEAKSPSSNTNSKGELEKASEAIHALTATRTFWYETWEKAEPFAASEQEPLFDPEVASAVAIHALETIHPAHLLNQILAVNLSGAVFALHAEAGATRQIPAVRNALNKLGNLVEAALLDLMSDRSGQRGKTKDDIERFISVDTVASCEEACNAIGEVEVVVSRAMSLLSKFPGQYSLIEAILVGGRGMVVADDHGTRADVIELILSQQRRRDATPESVPSPSLQEYVLQNQSGRQDVPCQLTARLGSSQHSSQRGLLLALSKCDRS